MSRFPPMAVAAAVLSAAAGCMNEVALDSRATYAVVQEARAPGFTLACKHRIEFDGMDRVEVTVRPEGKVNVDRLWIELPMKGVRFMYDYASDSRTWVAGLVSDRTWQRAQHIWLGNDRVGLKLPGRSAEMLGLHRRSGTDRV